MGKVYKVYRVDYLTRWRSRSAPVTERRNLSRGTASYLGLMKLARKMFAQSPRTSADHHRGRASTAEPHQIATRTGSSAGSARRPPDSSHKEPAAPPLM